MALLDKLDKRILYELDKNSRATASDLARIVRQGRDRVEYRIDRLVDTKIIRRFTASVNLSLLGFTIYKMYMRLNADKEDKKKFIKYLRANPRVYWIALCDGTWDLMIAVFARTSNEYYKIQHQILSDYNDKIINFEMFQLIELDVFHKHYLVNTGDSSFKIGGKAPIVEIDSIDYSILKELSNDSRRSNVELANATRTTPAIVKGRIDKLIENKVITGFRIEIDHFSLGMEFFKAQLYLRSYESRLLKKFRSYCIQHPHITYFIQQLGSTMVEVEMEVNNYQHYYEIIEEIREEFSDLIRNFQSSIIRKTYFSWFPNDLA